MKHIIKAVFTNLLMFGSISIVRAQTDYGDGSLRLRASASESWSASDNKYLKSDSWRYEYNAAGQQTRVTAMSYSTITQVWNPWHVKLSVYNSSGLKIAEVDSNLIPSQYQFRSRNEFVYNSSKKVSQEVNYSWNSSKSSWVKNRRYFYAYKVSGDLDTMLTENYDEASGSFKKYQKEWYKYDAGKRIIERYTQLFSGISNTWVDYRLENTTYTATGKQATFQRMGMNVSTKQWQNSERGEYDYNQDDKIVSDKYYTWNNTSKVWEYASRTNYTYGANTYSHVSENFDKTTQTWQGGWKYTYLLLPAGWPAEITIQQWDNTSKTWKNSYKQGWDYNANGYGIYFLNQIWDAGNSKWGNAARSRYYYDNNVKLKNTVNIPGLTAFPNPAGQVFNLTGIWDAGSAVDVILYDVSGKEVMSCRYAVVAANENIQIAAAGSGLKQGLYFVTVSNNGRISQIPVLIGEAR